MKKVKIVAGLVAVCVPIAFVLAVLNVNPLIGSVLLWIGAVPVTIATAFAALVAIQD